MSKYTTEVRFICENYSGLEESKGYANVEEIIANSRSKVFDFSYPIYDEEYRSVLETKILKHFYTREIASETVGLWKLWLNTRMNEIMPYYNQLYETTLLKFNPLVDVDLTTDRKGEVVGGKEDNGETERITNGNSELTRENSGSGKNTTNVDSHTSVGENANKWNMYSDTPQGGLNGIEDNTYLTNATHDTDVFSSDTDVHSEGETNNEYSDNGKDIGKTDSKENGTNKLTSNYSNTEEYLEHITGKRGGLTYSKMLLEFRDTIVNIDLEIIHRLDDLFMNLW